MRNLNPFESQFAEPTLGWPAWGGAVAEALEVSYVNEVLSRISSSLTLCPRMQNLAQFKSRQP
jgi:hypothetical protein